jgi:hypothetical protein
VEYVVVLEDVVEALGILACDLARYSPLAFELFGQYRFD